MTVAKLIEQLSKMPHGMSVATGFPAVYQGELENYRQSLCGVIDVKELHLEWDTWRGRDFVFIEVMPELVLGSPQN